MQVDKGLIRELANLLNETNLTEIEVEEADRRIRVARNLATGAVAAAPAAAAAAPLIVAAAPAEAAKAGEHPGAVFSPMVGTVYTAPEPDAPAFVSVGTQVEAGQTLLIIEAMKVMNPIPAPRGGTVKKIFVANAQPVEYGEVLMVIE
ncbi:MAG: acetyl-CoA carboxylase biotin carboxyl carrier protein [Proteobacteria bacterium]|nr:MAG: acetyl-CoA carboxylase biotin carboxyl carrier protein [Pseudomonadota bacterium]